VLDQAVRTVREEVDSLRHLLDEFAEFGRLPAPRFAPCTAAELIGDLGTLYGLEVADGRLVLTAPARDTSFEADAGQMRQALINLIKNGFEAAGAAGHVRVSASSLDTAVEFAVADDGPGLDADARAQLFTPGFTTKSGGSGLGLTIVQRIVHEHEGTIAVESAGGNGTTIRVRVPRAQAAAPDARARS
jgi:two-component system nitrogen regulation sensor histidine kinase NtrY